MRPNASLTAAVATIIFIGTFGLLWVVAGFGVIDLIEGMLEALGVLPPRWGESHLVLLIQISAVISTPIVAGFSLWFFRKARAAEVRMLAQASST